MLLEVGTLDIPILINQSILVFRVSTTHIWFTVMYDLLWLLTHKVISFMILYISI